MAPAYLDRQQRLCRMTRALRRHLDQPGSLNCGRKRQAAYIIDDIDVADCINLDAEAHTIERARPRR